MVPQNENSEYVANATVGEIKALSQAWVVSIGLTSLAILGLVGTYIGAIYTYRRWRRARPAGEKGVLLQQSGSQHA